MRKGTMLLYFVLVFCVSPVFPQGWTVNNAMQPTWNRQQNASPRRQVQAQPVPRPRNRGQQTGRSQRTGQTSAQQTRSRPVAIQQPRQQTTTISPVDEKGSGIGVRMLSIRAGDGKTFPSMGQNVTVHYTGKLHSTGEQFDSSYDRGEPFTFTLGVGQVIRGWDIAVAHLTVGQKARFTVGPEYAYGDQGIPGYQQGWTGNSAQPTWQQGANTQQVQAQPVQQQPQQNWNQGQQTGQTQWAGQAQQTQQWSGQQGQAQASAQTNAQNEQGSGVGVRMLSIRAGDGKTFPSMGQNVTVHYTGKLYSTGEQFDSSIERGKPFTFTLGVGQVIRGWDIAVAHLTVGQKARFTVGPEYAYGDQGIPGTIPPKSILVFDVELLSIS